MTEPGAPAPAQRPPRGFPRWLRVVLMLLAVLIILAGICTAIVTSSL